MIHRLVLPVLALALFGLVACGGDDSTANGSSSTGATSSSSSSSSSSSGAGGGGPITCGASQGVTATPSMTAPSFDWPTMQSCKVTAVATSPDLSVEVGCDDGQGGTGTLTLTVQASPPIATSLKVGDSVYYYHQSQNIEGPETWAALLDTNQDIVLGFVDAGALGGVGSPSWDSPFIAKSAPCSDDAVRQAVTFDWGSGQATIADGQRGTIGAQGEYVAQVARATVDPNRPSMVSQYTIVIARQP